MIFNLNSIDEINITYLYVTTVFALILLDMIPYIMANHSLKRLKGVLQNENLVKDKIIVEIGENTNGISKSN